MLFKIIYNLGVLFRNKDIFKSYRILKESESLSLEELKELQFNKCRELLFFAYNNSPYYKKKFDEAGFKPEDFKSLADLSKIPVLKKDDLLKLTDQIQVKTGFKKMFKSQTSGSTRQPLAFYRNGEWDAMHRAAIMRGYSWHGVSPWDNNGYFWGYNISPKKRRIVRFLDFLMNRFRMFSYDIDEIRKFVKKLEKAEYLEGYSSMIYEVAKVINKENIKGKFKLKMVKGTSEKIFDKYQEEALKAFGKKIISEYGATEGGIIAFECARGNMHITMENVIVEEENNEIIITNLESKSFPIIRYKLGDYVVIDRETSCPCGMKHEIIKEVMGRVGDVIYGFNKKYPGLMFNYVFKNLFKTYGTIVNYQVIQHEKGKIDLVLEQELDSKMKEHLDSELKRYFGDDLLINIYKGEIQRDNTRKHKDFISNIKN